MRWLQLVFSSKYNASDGCTKLENTYESNQILQLKFPLTTDSDCPVINLLNYTSQSNPENGQL